MEIEGSGALVVGGASGLGEATARRLHAQGAAVTIADVNAEKGQALADELGAAFAACDVREEDQVQAAVEAAAAGRRRAAHLRELRRHRMRAEDRRLARAHALEPFAVIIAINLIGTFNVLRFASTHAGQRAARGRRARRVRQHRLDRRLRRPGRPGRLQRLEGRRGRHDAAGGPRPGARRASAYHHRPRPLRHAAAAALPPEARESLGQVDPVPPRLGLPVRVRALRRTSSRTGCSTARSSGSTARCGRPPAADMGGAFVKGGGDRGRRVPGRVCCGCGSGCGWRPKRRGHFRLICEGWVPQDGLCDVPGPRSRIERASRAGAHSRIAGPGWHASAATPTSNGLLWSWSVGLAGDLPDKAGQLAGDGDRDGRALLGARGVEVRPAAVQAQLRAPGGVDRGRRLAGLAAAQRQRDARRGGGSARRPRSAAGGRARSRPW